MKIKQWHERNHAMLFPDIFTKEISSPNYKANSIFLNLLPVKCNKLTHVRTECRDLVEFYVSYPSLPAMGNKNMQQMEISIMKCRKNEGALMIRERGGM
jgi:hypothetical protein